MSTHHCPICQTTLPIVPRYPHYVCDNCARKACDANGRSLTFHNTHLSGGFAASYRDNGQPYHSHHCFIDGRGCQADEARFSGIVIQLWV